MTSVLIIDDDPSLLRTLSISLRAQGFDVARSSTGESGLATADRDHPDIVVVDLGLPKMSGMQVVVELRSVSKVPIIVLSARHQEATKVEALNAGADDYVTKPFGIDEFVARLRAASRRGVRADGEMLIDAGNFTVDLNAKIVMRETEEVRLTATEWRVLSVLIGGEPGVVTHDELLSAVWGKASQAPVEYARVHIASLRRKLEVDPSKPVHVVTEPGIGYRFRRSGLPLPS